MKTALSLAISFVLLFACVSVQAVTVARANWLGPLPDPTPHISVQTPKNGSRYFQDQVSITLTTTVALGSDVKITYQLDHQASVEMARSNDAGTEYSALLPSLFDGWHTLNVLAYGENWETAGSDTASITFLVDVVPPTVTVLSPRNQTYTITEVPLNFTLSEKTDWMGYSLDGQPQTTVTGNTTLTELPQGLHNVTVYANDTVGRKGNSETVYFNITQETEQEFTAQPETFPITPMAVASGVSVAVAAAGLLVYFRKRKRGQPT